MTGEVPPGIATPDKIMTRFGDLNFFDGVPDKETREKVYNHLDFQHGFQAFMGGIQIASMDALRKGILEFGPANTTPFLFSADETADVGTDGATPVTEEYAEGDNAFTGKIEKVTVDLN